MIQIGVKFDPQNLAEFQSRIQDSVRRLGNRQFIADLEQLLIEENARNALAGRDKNGWPLNPWQVRKGRSDFHGRDYASYTNATVLVPFGRSSRRIKDFQVEISRRSVLGVGVGKVELRAGFGPRSRLVPLYWRMRGRDVLGMPPRTRRAVEKLCTRHASFVHRGLKRGAATVRRSAAALFT